eukprot:844472_1
MTILRSSTSRFCISLLTYSIFFIQWIHAQTDMWYESMNSDPAQSNGWAGITPSLTTNNTACPGATAYCWSFLNSPGSYQRSASTTQFISVQLTYSISSSDINGTESCYIDYSVDDTNFINIETIDEETGDVDATAQIYNSWTGAAGISSLTIQIGSIKAGAGCYFNEFRLSGTPITSQPTLPTTTPSDTPTNAPSNSPSQPPTNAPSRAPTQPPTNAPSSAPSPLTAVPSDAPTAVTSQPTLHPTASPTYAAPVNASCGIRCTEYHINIAPKPGVVSSRTIAVQGVDPGQYVSYYRILLTPKGYPCTDPAMTATFQPIDYEHPAQTLTLTGQYGSTTCGGSIAASCTAPFAPCLLNQNLGIIEINPEHETQIIQITRSPHVGSFHSSCRHIDPEHVWVVNMQVTITCSAQTSNPTNAPSTTPTRTPTAITSQPTPNPIIKTADCDTNRDCWSVNVIPVLHSFMSASVTVLSGTESAVDTYYDVTFTVNTVACNRPSIDFIFEPTDNDSSGESLYVSAPGLSTQTCGGSSTYCSTCCSWFTCLSQMSVNNDAPIPIGQSITVTIQRDSSVGMQYCDDLNDVKAKVTLNCDDSTSSPTSAPSSPPTAAPSSVTITPSTSPSPAPTSAPSDTPTSSTAIPTNTPSATPTQPSVTPSQPPTRTPTAITSQPTPNPIIKTADCDTNRDCWGVKVTPVPLKFMSVPVTVLSGIEIAVDTYYDVTFTINTMACNRPSIDFVFLPTDNSQTNQWLKVSAPGLSAQFCGGSSEYCISCCYWFTCLSQVSVNNDLPIAIGENITVTIMKSSPVYRNFCDSYNDVKAIVTLNCDDAPTAAPSGVTNTPSSAPSHPSHAPTSAAPTAITTIPTKAPSGSPTLATAGPSTAPTQTPTTAPSGTPSVAPTQPPTSSSRSPTAITSQPTPNPTIKTADCDTNRDCWSVNVTPVLHSFTSVPVTVLSGIVSMGGEGEGEGEGEAAVDTYYDVTFAINTMECNHPSIDFVFEPTDNDEDGESLYVSAPGLSNQTCGGSSIYCQTCCNWFTCLSQVSVNNDLPIATGESITVTIRRDSSVDLHHCGDANDVKAIVALNCDDRTASPTSTPSITPTSSPTSTTAVPTDLPSRFPTQPSQSPTRTPTVIGYQYPTTAPSWDASCSSNTMDSLPFSSYIQTFDASSIITNDQLKITEITINYHYETQVAPVHFVFKLEVFVPHYLDRFYRYDHVDYKFATAQTPVTLTETMPTQGLLQVTFSNLDITLGCNERYHVNGYQGRFAIYAYPTNCVNDDKCEQLSDIWPRTCNMTSGDETLFIYDNGNYVPADLERLLDWPDDPTERNDLRMSFDIVYANSIDCTCDTSIEMARGDCGKPDHPLSWPVSQAFRTDCFSSQHLDFIHIMIGWGVDNMGAIAPPNETFTLVIEDTSTYSGTTIDTMQLPWSSSIINGTGGSDTYHTETIAFPITLSDLFIGSCDRELQWTLSCANCSLQSFYQQTPFVVSCDTALHMAHDFANPQPPEYGEGFDAWDGYYAAFQLGTDAAFTCPSGTPCLPFDQCPTEAPTSAQPSNTPTFKPTSFPSISPVTPPPSTNPVINIVNMAGTEDGGTMGSGQAPSSNWDVVGYVIIAILLCIPVFALIGGVVYHRKQKGSDNPNYLAVVRCFLNIADVYTDFAFSISLMVAPQQQDNALGIVAAIFTAVTHIISISVCLKTLHRWRMHKVLKYYVEQYDALIIAISCLAGFYPAVDLLSSKLFHLSQTSFHLDKAEFFMLKQFRFFTNCLLENMPLMTIQIYLILRSTSIESVPPMTILAFVFSVISLLVGMLTLISRAFGGFSQAEDEKQRSVYRLEMQSKSFQRKHQFIHSTFQKVMSRCLEINTNRIETILIIPTLKGISIIFSVKNEKEGDSEGNENEFEQKLNNVLQHHMDDFKLLLVKYLNVKDFDDLTVAIERLIEKETQTETEAHQSHQIIPLTETQSHGDVPL